MNQKQSSSESGQVLVILVLVIVGLLAFAALAIDGGMILVDRRGAQNAGDAAVLAGSYRIANSLDDFELDIQMGYQDWDCSSGDMTTAKDLGRQLAKDQAIKNGYPIDPITGTTNVEGELIITCEQGEDFGSYVDKFVDTEVILTTRVNTAFVHFAYSGPVEQTTNAIGRVRPRMPLAFGYPVYAHSDSCGSNGGVRFDGGGQTVTINGFVDLDGNNYGIVSDACLNASGANVNANGGLVNYISSYVPGSISPAPVQQADVLPGWSLLFSEIDCEDALSGSSSDGNGTINPGIYSGITVDSGEILTMNPGLYCFDNSFTINSGGKVTGNGVTIYLRTGNFVSSGGADIRLSAPTFSLNSAGGITGMLFYMVRDNPGQISLLGHYVDPDNRSYYFGTVFAANEDSVISVSGTGNQMLEYNVQLIAGEVLFHDTVTAIIIDPTYAGDNVFTLPAGLGLEK